MKWPLYEEVVLLKDFPKEELQAGDVVTTVEFMKSPRPGMPNGYFVEAFNAAGKIVAVFDVFEDDIEAPADESMLSHNPSAAS